MQTARLIVQPVPFDEPAGGDDPIGLPGRYRLAHGRTVAAELTGSDAITATVSHDAASSKLALFVLSRDARTIRLRVLVRELAIVRVLKHEVLDGLDPLSAPSRLAHGASLGDGELHVMLAPDAWTVLHVAVWQRATGDTRYAS